MFYVISARYRADIEETHEPDEIEEYMQLHVQMTHVKARLEISVFRADAEIVKKYAGGDFSGLISAVKYAELYEPGFSPFPLLDRAFSEYRPPKDAEELLLKAEIAGDEKWAGFWRKYAAVG